MKRLKNKLLSMEPNTSTYKEMYEGSMTVIDTVNPMSAPVFENSSIYYSDNVGYEISATHKNAQDKPVVVFSIPCSVLGIDVPDKVCRNAEADYCLRTFKKYVDELNADLYNRNRPDDENGKYYLYAPGGEILQRNSAYFDVCPQKDYTNGTGSTVYLLNDGIDRPPVTCLCIRIQVQLPKKKLRKVIQMMCKDLPDAVDRFISDFDITALKKVAELAEKQFAIREWLKNSDYCAFVANGSILPRAKGTGLPLAEAIPFRSTPDDEIEICGVKGLGIKKGVTVITGGGYSGKSTLLDAISAGIYDHALGDGRELCITDETAVTISAEDGRSIKHINISPFIKWLPGGDTGDFSTEHASGSTSQAANIMEAVDSGARLLLIDEDRSATNFMIRDSMMKALIEKEPITPFTDRANELHMKCGVSTILVIGGSGEYLSIADKIFMLEDYQLRDVTDKARELSLKKVIDTELPPNADWSQGRILLSEHFTSYPENCGVERLEISNNAFVIIGDERIDIRGLHNIVSDCQINTLARMLRYLEVSNNTLRIDISKRIDDLYAQIDEKGIDFLYSHIFTTCERFLDLPRKYELVALINRMRKINIMKELRDEM